ncbi:glycosyltransferase involved in cell wall biosynthesis [Erythromicrobium ramosum]|uniref:Glycosyltransferase n=1 Tax=Erythrobacter ramosus TaxID=35811 RepID=A0A6I4ULY8_9SPHN|nr:glycosyltransferase family 4 protein [Erythrobacter ramosus]MBB3777194.1 glycosyltransferase involved in cell wall biosynthesis [Erythrobacter ramosus]MXP39970.1 glycosyltransferase [Erythrobacter ramosus]
MRIILINRFFFPDESATSLMLTDLVEGLAPLGVAMHAITASASYTGTEGSAQALSVPDLTVTRLPTLPLSHQSLAGRVLNFLVFYLALLVAGVWHVRRGDLIICLTDPPFVGVFATIIAKLRQAKVIHWVQDIYPETATRLGYGSSSSPSIRMLAAARDWAWRNAAANVVIGDRMRDMLCSRGVEPQQIRVIPNWADDEGLAPISPEANPLRCEWGFSDATLVVGYSGNLGRAHDVDTMLGAAALLAKGPSPDIRFLFIGGGAKHAQLQAAMSDPHLGPMLERRGYRPRIELSQSLNVPDVHWLSLEPGLEGLIVPSKFYGAAAVGRPIIFIGDPDGEVARLIAIASCGASFAKGDCAGVASFLSQLASDSALRDRLGANAHVFSRSALAREQRLSDWRALISGLQASMTAGPWKAGQAA